MASSLSVLITGATDGLGRALAHRLAIDGATLILHGRDPAKLDRVTDETIDLGALATHPLLADLSELSQVRDLAVAVADAAPRLDVLVSNAGIGSGLPDSRQRQVSRDGYELRFAVNYLAGFQLQLELLALLERSAPARIVNVASLGQHAIDFSDVMLERDYEGSRAYAQSKLAQIMAAFELATRVSPKLITVNSLHPGTYMPTKIVLNEIGHNVDSLEQGVEATRRLAVGADLDNVTGCFFNGLHEARADPQAYDPEARARLWELSTQLMASS
ncbi:MAG: SDR family NAD(P)-dependent oxidoreductase [Actinomycetota bacterium]|nr:SDR family NAD(P)-dependent oxidoreductase [Actinomycetota bacterium]